MNSFFAAACLVVSATSLASSESKGENPFGTTVVPLRYTVTVAAGADATEEGPGQGDNRSTEQFPAQAAFSANDSLSASDSDRGDSAEGEASYNANFSLDTSTGVLSGVFSASGSASSVNGSTNEDSPIGEPRAQFTLIFELEGPATIAITGNGEGSGTPFPSFGSASIEVLSFNPLVQEFIGAEGGSNAAPIDVEMALEPGAYELRFRVGGEAYFDNDEDLGSAQCAASITANVTITPEVDDVFWAVNDGDYDVAENWEPQQVPGAAQTAIFDRNASYTVTIGDEETGRAEVERGIVAFTGNTYTLSGGDEDTGSFIVGASSEDVASLELRLNQLNTLHTIIGDLGVTNASVLSILSTVWANQGRMTVGRDGIGSLTVGNDSRLTTGELRVGNAPGSMGSMLVFGPGTSKQETPMTLVAGSTAIGLEGTGSISVTDAFLTTGETQLGVFPGSMGTMSIEESENFTLWDLTGGLFVGNEGSGIVEIATGGILRSKLDLTTDMIVANAEGSTGCVSVNGFLATLGARGDLFVGPGGMGRVLASNGGRVVANDLYLGPTDASNENARGDIILIGDGEPSEMPQLQIAGELVVGQAGIGTLIAVDESLITSQSGNIGGGPAGNGFVDLTQSTWRIERGLGIGEFDFDGTTVLGSGDLTLVDADVEAGTIVILFDGSRIDGTGFITAPIAELAGTVSPGIAVSSRKQGDPITMCTDAEEPKQNEQEDPIGTLTFDGDATFEGATITIEASGDGKGQFDAIDVTGVAELQAASVQFVFIDGYLPKTGDELPFLTAANVTIDGATTFTYTGAAPGFEFDVMNTGGALLFQAQSDAQAEGGEGEGEGEGEGDGEPGGCASGGFSNSNGSGSMQLDLAICIAAVLVASARGRRGRPYNDFRRISKHGS